MSSRHYDPALGQVYVDEAYVWAAVCLSGSPRPFVHGSCVYSTRVEVMKAIGSVWHGDWRLGWRKAKRRGWRCLRVKVELSFGDGR